MASPWFQVAALVKVLGIHSFGKSWTSTCRCTYQASNVVASRDVDRPPQDTAHNQNKVISGQLGETTTLSRTGRRGDMSVCGPRLAGASLKQEQTEHRKPGRTHIRWLFGIPGSCSDGKACRGKDPGASLPTKAKRYATEEYALEATEGRVGLCSWSRLRWGEAASSELEANTQGKQENDDKICSHQHGVINCTHFKKPGVLGCWQLSSFCFSAPRKTRGE